MTGGAAHNADGRVLRAVLRSVGVRTGQIEDASPRRLEMAADRLRHQAENPPDRSQNSGDGGAGYVRRRRRLAARIRAHLALEVSERDAWRQIEARNWRPGDDD